MHEKIKKLILNYKKYIEQIVSSYFDELWKDWNWDKYFGKYSDIILEWEYASLQLFIYAHLLNYNILPAKIPLMKFERKAREGDFNAIFCDKKLTQVFVGLCDKDNNINSDLDYVYCYDIKSNKMGIIKLKDAIFSIERLKI